MRPAQSAPSLGLGISWRLQGMTSRWGSTAPARTREVLHPVGSAERIRSEAELGSADMVMFYDMLFGSRARRVLQKEFQHCADYDFHIDAHSYKSNIGMHLWKWSQSHLFMFSVPGLPMECCCFSSAESPRTSHWSRPWAMPRTGSAAGDDKKLRICHEARGLGLGCLTGRLGYSRLLWCTFADGTFQDSLQQKG